MTAEEIGKESKRLPGLPCTVPADTITGTKRTGELQEGLETNRPRGEEEMEQKEETGH